jgi:hypothetical protein
MIKLRFLPARVPTKFEQFICVRVVTVLEVNKKQPFESKRVFDGLELDVVFVDVIHLGH